MTSLAHQDDRQLGGSLSVLTRQKRDHVRLDRLLHELAVAPAGDVQDRVLQEDVRDEEDELFPRLQERTSEGRLRLLGLVWEVVRRLAPTRPHPIVARRPPGNALAALPLTLTDRARDNLDRIAQRSERLRDPATRASDALGVLAGRIEHLPVLRAGERAATSRPPGSAGAGTIGGPA